MNNDKETLKKEFSKKIYAFVRSLIQFVEALDKKDPLCKVVSYQIIDSGTGIGSNYAEAQVSSSRKDFTNYFHYCLRCASETKFWLYLLRDSKKGNEHELQNLLHQLSEITRIFVSSILTLKDKK